MARRAAKRARGAKNRGKSKTEQPMLPNIVAGALAVGTEVGRVALRAAQGVFDAAGRFAGRTEPSPASPKALESAGASVRRASDLPEAELNAIAQSRRRELKATAARNSPAGRKPPTRSPGRTGQSLARRRRSKTA